MTSDDHTPANEPVELVGGGLPRFLTPLAPLVDLAARVRAGVYAKLLVGFLTGATLLLAMGALSLVVITRMDNDVDTLMRHHHRVELANQMLYLVTAQSHWRAMALLTGDDAQNDRIATAKVDFQEKLAETAALSPPEEDMLFQHLQDTDQRFAESSQRALDFYLAGNIDEALRVHLEEEHPISHELEDDLAELITAANRDMLAAQGEFESNRSILTIVVGIFSGVSLITAALLGVVLASSFVRPVRRIGGSLERLATGDFYARVDVPNRDEFGELSANLNRTSRHLSHLYRELAVTRDQALDATRAKSEFLANMSHELRTPLNAIIGYSEMLQEEATLLQQDSFVTDLQRINSAGKHLLDLINGVLDLSKVEAGKMELYLESFNLSQVVQDVVSVVQPLADKNNNTLQVSCDPAIGNMRADVVKVRQTLFNLLSNACKFTEHGRISFEVWKQQEEAGEFVFCQIADTGIGITEEQMTKLFQAFSQAEASTTRKFGGTGLGLVLSRRFCRMMGGDIQVESEYGKGARFTVKLPTVVDEESADKTSAAASGQDGLATASATGVVLVIDDDPVARELISRILYSAGLRVERASSGQEGLRRAKELRPDLISLDVLMSDMDGWAVLTALKADPAVAEIPVVMVSVVEDQNLGYMLGATDYITKPVDRNRLLSAVNRYLVDAQAATVLVVDDDATTRALLRRTLEAEAWRVVEAENGRVALHIMADLRPDLILLDLMMPEMDGFQFVEELMLREVWRDVPVIVITSKDLSVADRKQLAGNVQRIVQKGAYGKEQFLTEVRRLTEDRSLAKATGEAVKNG